MSRISAGEVAHVTGLAHTALTPEKVEHIAGELDVIATSVARVSEVTATDILAASHAVPLTNVMREDVVSPTLDREEVPSQTPTSGEGILLVLQILGEE